jgi:hypothetical protein
MKKTFQSFVVLGLLLALPTLKLHAQASFEGTITWSMTIPQMGDEDKHSMIINVKGDKSESEMDMGAMGLMKTYSDPSTNKTYMVMGAMKTGYFFDKKDTDNQKMASKAMDSLDIKPTGQKTTVAGHPAEEYLLKGLKMIDEVSLWVTPDFPKDMQKSFYHSLNNNPGQDPKEAKAMRQLADRGLVPVRIVARKGAEVAMTMEFVKFEQKGLDDKLFVPPSDVKFNPMPKMGGGGTN